jgi:hypothetical protein
LKCYSGQTDFGSFTTYNLPSGAELLVGSINPIFRCNDKKYGYYAGRFDELWTMNLHMKKYELTFI